MTDSEIEWLFRREATFYRMGDVSVIEWRDEAGEMQMVAKVDPRAAIDAAMDEKEGE